MKILLERLPVRFAAALGLMLFILPLIIVSCGTRSADRRAPQDTANEETQPSITRAGVPEEERAVGVNRIAYTDAEGKLFTINPDGTDARRLAGGGFAGSAGLIQAQGVTESVLYTWPTWSPNGEKLGLSRVLFRDSGSIVSVHVLDIASEQSTTVYEDEPGGMRLVAAEAPHYLYWSPDSSLLTFIANTRSGLTLFAVAAEGQTVAVPLAFQGPMYYSWSPDSDFLLMHRGQQLLLAQTPSFDQQQELTEVGFGFRAPAFSPRSSQAVYVGPTADGKALFLIDAEKDEPATTIADVGLSTAFLWSPKGDEVAIADSLDAPQALYQRLNIVRADGSGERTLVREPFMAFFWSPDGERILYATISPSGRSLLWKVISAGGGTPKEMVEFSPSRETFTVLSFFDQYAYSHGLWSPDGSQFVFAGTLPGDSAETNGASPSANKIYVVDVESGSVREIASGSVAFWSWN